jgi:hypothetical protein
MRPRRPTRFVLEVGIWKCRVFSRIPWTARTLHETTEAISLVSYPFISNVLIKRCCATSICDAIITADMNRLNSILAGCGKEEQIGGRGRQMTTGAISDGYLGYNLRSLHSHKPQEMAPPLK